MSSQPEADAPLAQKNKAHIVASATMTEEFFSLVERFAAKSRCCLAGTLTFYKVLVAVARHLIRMSFFVSTKLPA